MIQNLVIQIFVHTFYCSSRHLQSFIYPESVEASKNYRKRSLILQYSFAKKTSLNLRISTHIENNMALQHSQNLFEFTKIFQQTCFCLLSEKTFALHHFLTPKTAFLKHFESKCPFISVYLRTKRRSKILSDEVWVGGS